MTIILATTATNEIINNNDFLTKESITLSVFYKTFLLSLQCFSIFHYFLHFQLFYYIVYWFSSETRVLLLKYSYDEFRYRSLQNGNCLGIVYVRKGAKYRWSYCLTVDFILFYHSGENTNCLFSCFKCICDLFYKYLSKCLYLIYALYLVEICRFLSRRNLY